MLAQIMGRADEAIDLNEKILRLDPNNVVASNNLSWVLCEERQEYERALELAENALRLAPDYWDLVDTRGVIRYRLGEYEAAIKDFLYCIELYPPNRPASGASRFHLARAYAKVGRRMEAIEQLTQALDLQSQVGGLSDREFDEAQLLLEELKKGS